MPNGRPLDLRSRRPLTVNGDAASRNWWPTRVGTARIELALAFAEQGRIDEAARTGADVLSADFLRRSTVWRAGELDKMLRKGHAGVPEVEDFHEQYLPSSTLDKAHSRQVVRNTCRGL